MAKTCQCSILATRVTMAVDVDGGTAQQLLCIDCGTVLDVRATRAARGGPALDESSAEWPARAMGAGDVSR